MKRKIATTWEMYVARRAFLLGDLVCVRLDAPGTPDAVAFRSESLNGVIASLLLVELVSIFDDALTLVLRGTGKPRKKNRGFTLKKRIDHGVDMGLIDDGAPLHEVRRRRDAVVHDYLTIAWRQLRADELAITAQLRAWGFVNGDPQLTAATEIGAWQPLAERWRRRVWAGVRDVSGVPAWGLEITEQRIREAGIDRPEHARSGGVQETPFEWYSAATLDRE